MRDLPPELQEMLRGPASTVCSAWIIARTDNEQIGLTDHDKSISIGNIQCDPMDGADRSAIEASLGANSDTGDLTGILYSDAITEADIQDGMYDDAVISHYAVDWNSPEAFVLLRQFRMGEITHGSGYYSVELRGSSTVLSRPNGRVFSQDAPKRDANGGVVFSATVVEQISARTLKLSFEEDVTVAQLQRAGLRHSPSNAHAFISSATAIGSGLYEVRLSASLGDMSTMDHVEIIEGFDGTFEAFKQRYGDGADFRGFPHMPGNYQVLNYIDEDTVFDGKPIVP
ncbi:MAG: DUF2163 domain-containing protein [Pseudomonadota bacterium]